MSQNQSANQPTPHVSAHPFVFLLLIMPFGIVGGYVPITLGYLFTKAGASTEAVAALVGAGLLPQVLKFLWAPLVDSSLSLKKWYLLSCVVTAASIAAMGIIPIQVANLPVMTLLVVIANVASSFVGMASNGLAAYDTPDELKGRVGGFLQAGNLGGGGLGGGAGLWLAETMNIAWMPACIIAFVCLLCCTGLFFVKEHVPTVKVSAVFKTLQNLFVDIWHTVKTRLGVLALILCFLPLGTGSAANLWSAVANDWHASAATVELATGVVSGFVTAAGCLLGGWICDRMDRQMAYVIFGLSLAVCAVAMAYSPHIQIMYIIWTMAYAFICGLCYAGFSAFVFEAIGKGAAATKYTVFASLSNLPIYYMTLVDGWGHTHYGPTGMLNIEAAFGVAGVVIFLLLIKMWGNPAKVSL